MDSTQVPPEIPDEAMNFMQQCLIKEPFHPPGTCVVNKGDKKKDAGGSLDFFLDSEIRVFFLMSQSSQMLVGDEKKGLDRF